MRFIVERIYDRIPYFSRYVPACWYLVNVCVRHMDPPPRHAKYTVLPKSSYTWVVPLKDLDLPNPKVLERRIAELAFPEVVNLADDAYPNRLPPTYWRGVPPEAWSNAKKEVYLKEIPPEWLEQDPKLCVNPRAHKRTVAQRIRDAAQA